MNTWQFHLSNWQGVAPVWTTSISFIYTGLLVWALPQSQRLNLIYCLKTYLLLAFCFLFVCMMDQTQMCPSSISPVRLFLGDHMFNTERLKADTLEPWITWVPKLEEEPNLKRGGVGWGGVLGPFFIPWGKHVYFPFTLGSISLET